MKIKEIRVVEIELNPKPTTTPRTPTNFSVAVDPEHIN